jgi:N-acetylglucosamine-6-phosphate deacetylase
LSAAGVLDSPVQLLAGGRVVTPKGVLESGWVQVAGDRIVAVAATRPSVDATVVDLAGAWVLPGYVDLHMHGGGGHSVAESREDMEAAVAFHHRHGTTTTLVSLMTRPVDELLIQLGWALELTRRGPSPHGRVVGSHLEGPFLSARRCGAQDGAHMLTPDGAALQQMLDAGDGTVKMMTLAPELDGALELIPILRAAGVIAAMGHSDATYEQGMAAITAGANHATHLFNAMPAFHHREPGLVGAALDGAISVELINDGRHIHPAVVRLICNIASCPVLVTDAIDATGVGVGEFVLGGQVVRVHDGETRLVSTGSLAGSTLTMDQALRRAVKQSGLSIEHASAAASANPARVLGLEDRIGAIATGLQADFVVLDDDLQVSDVMLSGAWIGHREH